MLSPSDLADVTTIDEDLLTLAERDIDAALRRDFDNTAEVWVDIQRSWTPRICRELVRRYTVAGWQVRWESDQRDGDALVFTAKEAP